MKRSDSLIARYEIEEINSRRGYSRGVCKGGAPTSIYTCRNENL